MPVHSPLVENVNRRRLGGSTGGQDVPRDGFDRCQMAPGDEKLGPLARKGACDSSADRSSGAIDHHNLVLQHQLVPFPVPSWPSVDARNVRAVDDVGTATWGKWARRDRPVLPSTGVGTGWK